MELLLACLVLAIIYISIGVCWVRRFYRNEDDNLILWLIFNWPLDIQIRLLIIAEDMQDKIFKRLGR